MLNRLRDRLETASAFAFFVLATVPAYAAGSNMPWEQPLTQILDSIQGPVAKVVSVIVIITTGLTLAFGEHRLRRVQLLSDLLPVRRRSVGLMDQVEPIPGFYAPVHRALTEPILLGGAPRAVAILNGTLAAAVGLGLRLWIVGGAIWLIGHLAAVWAAKRDPAFVDVVRRHLRYPQHLVA
jgi:type IV secretory pathway TrbD component/type IV secretory pathway VirB2 component (pilin)